MDGDVAPLADIVALKEKHGAWLMVDEAHATGLFGLGRRGVGEEQGVSRQIEIQMGTLGKAVGSAGGYICGSRPLIDLLINRARSFIFSTAPPPSQSAAAMAGIALIQSPEGQERCSTVWSLARELTSSLADCGLKAPQSAIVPIMIGAEGAAVSSATSLREAGLFVPAIRYPTVARGAARLRVTVTASHTGKDLTHLVSAIRQAVAAVSP
jgi:7-keto-8-aminopelargonate synthetase-like enzyme